VLTYSFKAIHSMLHWGRLLHSKQGNQEDIHWQLPVLLLCISLEEEFIFFCSFCMKNRTLQTHFMSLIFWGTFRDDFLSVI